MLDSYESQSHLTGMKIEKHAEGILHLIETGDTRSLRFESDDPQFQMMASLAVDRKKAPLYDVLKYARARLTLSVEFGDDLVFKQTLEA